MIVCQTCGYQNEDDDTFCGGCPAYLPHSGVHVDDDAGEEAVGEPVEVEVAATGLISRVKGMVGMDDAKDVPPGDVLVDEEAEREAREAAEQAQREADEAAAAAERAANEAAQRREAERQAREEAAELARREQEARAQAEAAAKAQAEAEAKAREEAEAKARAEAEEREKQAAAERAEAEARAEAAREAEVKAAADREARERAEAEAAAAVEAEERATKEAQAQALREAEERAKVEAQERARAEEEAAQRAAAAAKEREEAQRKAEEEAARRAAEEEEAKRKAEEEARRRAEEEEKARVEAERRAEEERKAAEQAEREAAAAAERARRAAAMVAKPAPPPARTRRVAAATAAGGTIAASTATAPAGTAPGGVVGAAGPTALKPTEQRPTAPPPRPPTKKVPPTRKPEPGDQICGQCGEPNRPERKFCRRCANTLADAVVVKRPFSQRIIPRRKPKTVVAGERPGRTAKGTRKQPLGRRIAKFGRMSVRWLIAGILILGVLAALGIGGTWTDPIQRRLDSAYDAVMNRIRPSYEPANPVEAVASAQTRGGGARRVIDGFDNTHWAAGVPVTARPTLELTWAEPTDIARVGILAGGSGDDFRTLARPREVRLVFSDGSRSDLTLKDVADFQTFKVGATQARTVRILVRSVYPAPDSDAVAITELEFFTRR